MWGLLLTLLSIIITAKCGPSSDFAPCKENDNICLTRISNNMYKAIITGIPSLNIEPADPMFHRDVEGNLATLKYRLTNSTIEGFKNCEVVDTTLSLEKYTMGFVLECPRFSMFGDYKIDGKLLSLPIQGNGGYTMECMDFHIQLNTNLKAYENEGKKYISIKSFTVSADLRGGMIVDLKNLFNGRKDLAEKVLKFMNTNVKPVADELQGPIVKLNFKRLIKSFNKYLRSKPVDTLVI